MKIVLVPIAIGVVAFLLNAGEDSGQVDDTCDPAP